MSFTVNITDAYRNGQHIGTVDVLDDSNHKHGRRVTLSSAADVDSFVGEIETRFGPEAAGVTRSQIDLAIADVPAEPWPDPLPLPNGLPAVLPFDFDLLPRALHAWIKDISDRMQCPPDYCATTAMIVAGSLIGRKVGIRPKRHDDWVVVCNLYGANIGRPSLMKSPAMQEVLKQLVRLEVQAKQDHAEALMKYEAAALVAEATKKVRKEELKKAVQKGKDAQGIAEKMAAEDKAPPTRRRYLVNDSTVEKLGCILAENSNGVLVFLDELISLLRTMDREGHEADRGFYLTAWAGNSRYTYDRIGRGTLDIEAAIVSILGSIQPGVLADYLRGAVNGGCGDDGLMQRFQLSVWPDPPTTWTNVDRYPDSQAKQQAFEALEWLAKFEAGEVDAQYDKIDKDAIPFVGFVSDAQQAFDVFREDLEHRLRSGTEHPAIESHLAKYRSLVPSLALIIHLLDGGKRSVNLRSLQRAIGWATYLESHARRIYSSVTNSSSVSARLLADRIYKGNVSNPFAARDVYRQGWTGLDRERTEAAIDVLLSLNWLEERQDPTAGRTRTRFAINPKIANTYSEQPTEPTEGSFVGSVGSLPETVEGV